MMEVELLRRSKELEHQQECLEQEKARMLKHNGSGADTIVDVNVGGKVFTTLQATLCSISGSFLEAIFSGRHKTLTRDGAIFIDRNPKYFELILDWLRSPTTARAESLPFSDPLFKEELEYYGLCDAIQKMRARSVFLVVGGQNASHERLSSLDLLDYESGTWESRAAMGQGRTYAGSCTLLGHMYVVGGQDAGPCSTVERYTASHDAWIAVAPMKCKRSGLACTAFEGCLYAVGGFNTAKHLTLVECYDPLRNEWTIAPPLPYAVKLLGLCAVGKYLYAVGGEAEGTSTNRACRYDSSLKAWTPISPMSTARDAFACAELDGMLYVCGGWDGSRALASAERYVPERDAWQLLAPMPCQRVSCMATAIDGSLVVAGGYNDESCLASVLRYDPVKDEWDALPPMPAARYGSSCAAVSVLQ